MDINQQRIALVVPGLSLGGGVPSVARFVKDAILRSGRYQVKLVSLAMDSADATHLLLRSPRHWLRGVTKSSGVWEGLPYVHVGAVFGDLEFQSYRSRKALAEAVSDCDLIQVVSGSPAWANAVLGLGKPVAVHAATRARIERRQRDASPRGLSGWWRRAMTEITDRMDDQAFRRADAIQLMNSWMLGYARTINTGRVDADIRFAPPGVDAVFFSPIDQRDLQNDPYILCVARLNDPRKNIILLLEAYALLPSHLREGVRLVLAGSSGPPHSFWQRADEFGLRDRITFIERPESNELVSLYQKAALFALPSDEEGFGVVLLEAMACGIPVVSTRSGGPEDIISDGDDGYLVALNDAVAMSKRFADLLQDPAINIAMGKKARQMVEHRYAEEVAGQVFLDIWQGLLEKKKNLIFNTLTAVDNSL